VKENSICKYCFLLAEQQVLSCKAMAPGDMSKWMKDWG